MGRKHRDNSSQLGFDFVAVVPNSASLETDVVLDEYSFPDPPEETYLDYLDYSFNDEEFPETEVRGHLDFNPPNTELDSEEYGAIWFDFDPYENLDFADILLPGHDFLSERDFDELFWDFSNFQDYHQDYGEEVEEDERFYDPGLFLEGLLVANKPVVAESPINYLAQLTYHCDATFEPGQFGKYVMYLTTDDEIHFAIGATHPLLEARLD